MILVGIDIAKDKHECFIRTLEGTVLHKSFSIANNLEGFEELYSKICSCNDKLRSGLKLSGIIPTTFWDFCSAKSCQLLYLIPCKQANLENHSRCFPKSLTRYRFEKVRQRAKLKQSLARLCNILFPELESAVSTLHLNCIYAMLLKYPSAKDIAKSRYLTLLPCFKRQT